jgi:hypothetical protein
VASKASLSELDSAQDIKAAAAAAAAAAGQQQQRQEQRATRRKWHRRHRSALCLALCFQPRRGMTASDDGEPGTMQMQDLSSHRLVLEQGQLEKLAAQQAKQQQREAKQQAKQEQQQAKQAQKELKKQSKLQEKEQRRATKQQEKEAVAAAGHPYFVNMPQRPDGAAAAALALQQPVNPLAGMSLAEAVLAQKQGLVQAYPSAAVLPLTRPTQTTVPGGQGAACVVALRRVEQRGK